MARKTRKYQGYALPVEVIQQRMEHRASGAAGFHGSRNTRRNRTRAAQLRNAVREHD